MSEELPEGWASVSLADLIDGFEAGRNLRAEGRRAEPREFGVLKISAVTWGAFRPGENKALLPGDEPKPHEIVRKNDLLITRANTSDLVGAVVLVDRDHPTLMLPDKILRLRLKRGLVEPGFVLQALRTKPVRDHFESNATGTSDSMRNLAQPKIAAAPVSLAPLPEQRRIVTQVEALLEQVNRAKGRLDRVPQILKRFRQSVLAAACSGELTREWRDAHPDLETGQHLQERIWNARRLRARAAGAAKPKTGTLSERSFESDLELPSLPGSWRWACWDDLCDWITYGFTRPMPHVTEGVPIVTARHVQNSCVDFSSVDFTTKTAFEDLSDKDRPLRGEILLTKDGSIGRAGIVESDGPFCINQSVMVLRFGGLTADPKYMLRAIECPWTQHLIDEGAKGSAIRHIAITAFGRFPVPLPPLAEQTEIVRQVEKLFAFAETIERRVKAATARADKLPQAILSKAFSGELVPTEAELARAEGRTYETAGELLRRVAGSAASDERPKVARRVKKTARA